MSIRTLVLCFDGTGNLYDATNTNVIKLFALLKKDNKDEQLVYYQAGIGTYSAPGMVTPVQLWAAKLMDEAFAWYLDAHVMGGYQFLMQNYTSGDRICLFGFSRGAYTARALAGMLYKVGLLPKDNPEQVGFAYKMYKATGRNNQKLAFGFKQTFSRNVTIEFMGCWDTVSSVGVFWGRHLPFTSSNTTIKRFRHALSLDEHRTKFQPNTWHRASPSPSAAKKDPEHGSHVRKSKESNLENGGPSDQPGATDVLEVWFAGCHSDVGGGETPTDAERSLSNVALRWMVREIVKSQCGIQFDNAALARADIPSTTTPTDGSDAAAKDDALDAIQPINDELKLTPIWWLLEVIPLFTSWQDETGTWHRRFRWNLGRGRTISAANPNMHTTVQQRMAEKSLAYIPKAKWTAKPAATWVT